MRAKGGDGVALFDTTGAELPLYCPFFVSKK